MGFNNGYESGYEDAKAELAPKMKALEARIAELEASGGHPASSALGALCLDISTIYSDGGIFIVGTSDTLRIFGAGLDRYDPSAGDHVKIHLVDDPSNGVVLPASLVAVAPKGYLTITRSASTTDGAVLESFFNSAQPFDEVAQLAGALVSIQVTVGGYAESVDLSVVEIDRINPENL